MKIKPQPTLPVFDGMVYTHGVYSRPFEKDRPCVRGEGCLLRGVQYPSLSGLVCAGHLAEFDLRHYKPRMILDLKTKEIKDERELRGIPPELWKDI